MNPYVKQYQRTEVETATPERVLILLYDGAIQFLNKAIIAIDENNIQEIHNNIVGAEHIIMEFINTLDFEQGGDFATKLSSLYYYFYNTLIEANLKKDKEKVQHVLTFLVDLRATWRQAIDMTMQDAQNIATQQQPMQSGVSYVSNSDGEFESDEYDYVDDDEDEEEDDDDNQGYSV